MTLDSTIAVGIVIGAFYYLYRKYTKTDSKSSGCGCASGGGCCGSQDHQSSTHSCTTRR